MATVYSLVCWGGRTGKTVSISASTDVVTLTKHGVRTGMKLWPSGTLPAELNSSTPVYGRATGIDTFTLHTSSAGAIANTGQITFAGSSTYSAVVIKSDLVASPATALSTYGLSDLSRWGASGSERIYDGLASWNAGRSGAGRTDIEVAEIGEAFTEIYTAQLVVNVPSAGNQIVTSINGKRTAGFHAGAVPKSTLVDQELAGGFICHTPSGSPYSIIQLTRYRDTIDGFTIFSTNSGAPTFAVDIGVQCSVKNCIFRSTTNIGTAIALRSALSEAINNLIFGWYRGFEPYPDQSGIRVMNNIVTKCNSGFPTNSAIRGFYYNNIVVGNSVSDWSTQPTSMEHASNNFGPSGAAWMATGAVRYTIATTDFADWANNDFRPASATSPQVDTGIYPYDGLTYDLAGNVRPSYKGGAATEIDGGPYEYDHGYGPWPASATINLSNIVSGSRVLITKASDGTVLYNDVPGGSLSFNTSHIGDFNVVVRKATSSPFYREFNASGTTVADQTTSIKCLQQLDE